MQKEFLVVVNGKPTGPFTLNELKNLDINANTFVRKQGMDDFKEAHAIAELRELFGFNFEKSSPQYFASFDQRLMATVIDHFIIFAIYVVLILISFAFISADARIFVALVPLPSIFIVKIIYGIITEASAKQATIGKKLMAIKVSNLHGERISIGKSIFRNFAKIFSIIPLFFGYLYCFLNKKNQCWHDIATETLVIKDRLI
jgi:uncharacterized RDD family membrane protein YckC